jgi:hypothetical protein
MCDLLQVGECEVSVHHVGNTMLLDWITTKKTTKTAPDTSTAVPDGSNYTDEDFAILRHIYTEGNLSSRKFGAIFAGFHYFFKRKVIEKDEMFGRRTLQASFMRLAHKDGMEVRATVASLGDVSDSHTTSYMTDCSFHGEERMVSYFSCSKPDMSGPTTCFTGIGAIADKDAATCAAACPLSSLTCTRSILICTRSIYIFIFDLRDGGDAAGFFLPP